MKWNLSCDYAQFGQYGPCWRDSYAMIMAVIGNKRLLYEREEQDVYVRERKTSTF